MQLRLSLIIVGGLQSIVNEALGDFLNADLPARPAGRPVKHEVPGVCGTNLLFRRMSTFGIVGRVRCADVPLRTADQPTSVRLTVESLRCGKRLMLKPSCRLRKFVSMR